MFPERLSMTRNEQEQFVVDMFFAVAKDIVEKFDSGAIPEHWSGVQLRAYITDKVRQRCDADRFMTSADLLKYNNEMITFNL